MAAPLLIIRRIIKLDENNLRIILFKSSRDVDISTFFRIRIGSGFSDFSIASAIIKKAENNNTLFSEELARVRSEKYVDIEFENIKTNSIKLIYENSIRIVTIE